MEIDYEDMEGDMIEQQNRSTALEEYSEDQLYEKAMQTMEDPGDCKGPVFPYWDEQPTNLEQFHSNQRYAHSKVLECVELGTQVLDLS